MTQISKEESRKNQILDAALEVVVEKGYADCRMDDIVETSGLSKGTIYWYYKSKKEVFLSLINHWVNKFGVTLNHIVEEDLSASDQLHELFAFFLDIYENKPDVLKAELEFWALASRDSDFRKKTQAVYRELLELIEAIVSKGVESGEFKNVEIKVAALSIMVNIEGIIWFALFDANGIKARHYIETISDFILAGLTKNTKGENNE
ncbi:MAG: TetR/AcrR family transcriptional regulator [Candidatus Marinimicrobia bacterium]|jgi:AcrR family transcriptional regulator|nr:TetR/AcrR family transcriptional regulator [Candidatus Neomarinimicrobiota bacterium]MDP7653602.1 TetR/AcrR family transcriptional regulator [Candidatus Neomarinimicrobiota bacterium]|tara:strand:+ start:2256 stop:2873 length:618 start_codon:yes stop_codon:yes gene_type:complete